MKNKTSNQLNIQNEKLEQRIDALEFSRNQFRVDTETIKQSLDATKNSGTYRIAEKLSNKIFCKTERHIYDYILSAVVAVYNTKEYLAEMIESVIRQKTDNLNPLLLKNHGVLTTQDNYKKLFELILVDDGSTDGSAEICNAYAEKYPFIKVIHKPNGGVSSARNEGIKTARGKYITFPDSDDILSDNVFEQCILFFELHEKEISLVAYPPVFFDGREGNHWTNYRFKQGSRIIDMQKDWVNPQYFTNSAIFRTMDIKNKISFKNTLSNGEDIIFVHDVLFSQGTYMGLLCECTYGYRRRSSGIKSAIQQSENDEKSYTYYLKNVLTDLLIKAEKTYGYIPRFVQNTVMGQLQWKFSVNDKGQKAKEVLGEEGFRTYKETAFSLLEKIDDRVILAQKKIWGEHFNYLFKHKYGRPLRQEKEDGDIRFLTEENALVASVSKCFVRCEFLKIENKLLIFEGYSMNLEPEMKLIIRVNGNACDYEQPEGRNLDRYSMDDIIFYAIPFRIKIPLNQEIDCYRIDLYTEYLGREIPKKVLRYHKMMPLSATFKKSYYRQEGWTARLEGRQFIVRNDAVYKERIDYEAEFLEEVNHSQERFSLNEILSCREEAIQYISKKKKKLWLISDRINAADDNGEAFFRFLNTYKDPDIEVFFLIEKECADYRELQKIGRVIAYNSHEHRVLHLAADYIISSAADEFVVNPWTESFEEAEVVRDLLQGHKFIFLQHGITKDNISFWLNKYNKDIKGFVCAAPRESQSILDYNYYYDVENIWLTGFPRHDRLYDNMKNKIVIMPTWRQYLSINSGTENELVADFDQSNYFLFYNALINHNRLLSAAEIFGYQICFMPHPGVKRHGMQLFSRDDRVEFLGFDAKYRDVYAEACLTVTDYSSSVMDFALLGKPVIYCQFDKEEFFSNHLYTAGYYDYEQDGFGEVTYDLESLVDVMIEYMKNGCTPHEPYITRMKTFFAFHDQNNCERVYKKIKALEQNDD